MFVTFWEYINKFNIGLYVGHNLARAKFGGIQMSKTDYEKTECCGKIFDTKEELEAHIKSAHGKGHCCCCS